MLTEYKGVKPEQERKYTTLFRKCVHVRCEVGIGPIQNFLAASYDVFEA